MSLNESDVFSCMADKRFTVCIHVNLDHVRDDLLVLEHDQYEGQNVRLACDPSDLDMLFLARSLLVKGITLAKMLEYPFNIYKVIQI